MKAACAEAGITPLLERVFRAIGRVATEQQLPIFTHHDVSVANGDAILDLFEDCGVAPVQVVLGHSGDTNDLDYLERMLQRGCWLGMDRFGHWTSATASTTGCGRPSNCADGVTPTDCSSPTTSPRTGRVRVLAGLRVARSVAAGVDFTFIHTEVLPALEAAGLEPSEVRAMLERNPANLFEVGSQTSTT